MNSSSLFAGRGASRAIRRFWWSVLAALPLGAPAAEPPAVLAAPKTHVLFMGADVDVLVKGLYYRVKSVSDASFIVRRKDEDIRVSVERGPVELRLRQALKLTGASATIDRLAVDRAYTPANDPHRKFAREQPGGGPAAVAGLAQARWNSAAIAANGTQGINSAQLAAGLITQSQADASNETMAAKASAAELSANQAFLAENSEVNNMGVWVSRLQDELAKELFDAVEVAFLVSSEKPLDDAYIVMSAWFQPPDTKPGTLQHWIYARSLGSVGPRPQKIRFTQGGFPPGFKLQRVELHLFNQGDELATNVSPKRVDLTFDEAFQYVGIEYLTSHRGATLPAAPVMGRLPPDWRQRLTAAQCSRLYFVKVDQGGRPLGAYEDEACSEPVADPYLESVIREIRFTPALDSGKPVAGTAKLRLGDIRL